MIYFELFKVEPNNIVSKYRISNAQSKMIKAEMALDFETRLELVKLYYKHDESATSAIRPCETKQKLHINPFSYTTIQRPINTFEDIKSFLDILHKDCENH